MSAPALSRLLFVILATLGFTSFSYAQCPVASGVQAQSRACSVRLTWQNQAGAGPAFNWTIVRGTSPVNVAAIATVGPSVFTFDDVPPQRGVTYYYAIRGNGLVDCPQNGPTSDPIPAGLINEPIVSSLQSVGQFCSGTPSLLWAAHPEATGYIVTRTPAGGSAVILTPTPVVSTVFTDNTAAGNVSYTYTVYVLTACVNATTGASITIFNSAYAVVGPAPAAVAKNSGESVTFNFNITGFGNSGSLSFAKDGQILTPTSRLSFSYQNQTLTINPVRPSDSGEYFFAIFTGCGVRYQSVVLAVRNTCTADINESGDVSVQDLFDFLARWFVACP